MSVRVRRHHRRGWWSESKRRDVLLATFSGELTLMGAARALRVSYDVVRQQRSKFLRTLAIAAGAGWPEVLAIFGKPGMTQAEITDLVQQDPNLSAIVASAAAAAGQLLGEDGLDRAGLSALAACLVVGKKLSEKLNESSR